MNEIDVVALLNKFKQIGVEVWLDGGWGVDALVGHQTRKHDDVDLFVQKNDERDVRALLSSMAFYEIPADFTTDDHTAWRDAQGSAVDLHVFEFINTEEVKFEGETYPFDVLNGSGQIGTIKVRCLTAEAQLLYHQGYEHDENDVHDVMLLCDTFGLSIPDEYKKEAIMCSVQEIDFGV